MAKVAFSKLGIKIPTETIEKIYCTSKGEQITYEVVKYLPFMDKVQMISNIINNSIDEHGYYNPLRVKLYTALEIIVFYTNLSFTDKMKEDPFKLYDMLISSGIYKDVIDAIGPVEWADIQDNIWATIKNIYDYKNSAAGILDMVTTDYNMMALDANNIKAALSDADNLTLLKSVVTKLG